MRLFNSTNLDSIESHLLYTENSGDITVSVEPQIVGASTFAAGKIYAHQFSENYISTVSLYTESLLNNDTSLDPASYPKFDILQSSLFVRGLSTNLVVSPQITGGAFYGNFIGSAQLLTNPPLLYSNLSAISMTVSTVSTGLVSSQLIELANPKISTFINIDKALYFGIPAAFLSTNISVDSDLFFGLFASSNTPFIQSVDQSTLTINNTLFFDATNKRLGLITSSPQYTLDISGSLYYSGFLYYGRQENILNFSTEKDVVSFSTVLYSSIYIHDTLKLPQNTSWPLQNGIAIQYSLPDTIPTTSPFILAESYFPITASNIYDTNIYYYSTGINTNSNFSTLDINNQLYFYNKTKNVGIQTSQIEVDQYGYFTATYPIPIDAAQDLVVSGDFQTNELRTSTMYIGCKLTASTIEMPTFGINPITVSTFHTLSTSFLTNLTNSLLTVDSFVDFYKSTNTVGYLSIKKPQTTPFSTALFSVYSDAYISSVNSQNLHLTNLFVGTQTI